MKLSIVVPTYNERENIDILVKRVFSTLKRSKINGELIIVDDNSLDGTYDIIKNYKKRFKNLNIVFRKRKLGLASAVLDGLKKSKGEILCVMDADLSHPPEKIPKMLDEINNGADFVIGSRYVKGGKMKGWTFYRRTVSKIAVILAKTVTDVKDPVSGFFMIRRECINGKKFTCRGFKICLEFIMKCNYNRIEEIPITSVNRKNGKSKLNFREYWIYLYDMFSYLTYKLKLFN